MTWGRMGGCSAWALAVVLCAATANAEATGEDCDNFGENRELKGHRFVTPRFADTALVLTAFAFRIGAEYERVDNVPVGGLGSVDLNAARALSIFELSLRLHDRVSIFGNFRDGIDSGTRPISIALRGAGYNVEGGGGAQVRLFTNESTGTQVSVRGGAAFGQGEVFSILPLLTNASRRPAFTVVDLVNGNAKELLTTPVTTQRYGGSASLAQTLTAAFAIQASLRLEQQHSTYEVFDVVSNTRQDQVVNTWLPQGALALTFNALPLKFPVAITPELRGAYVSSNNDYTGLDRSEFEADGALSIMYSGRADFEAGITGLASLNRARFKSVDPDGNTAQSEHPKAIGGEFVFRYIW